MAASFGDVESSISRFDPNHIRDDLLASWDIAEVNLICAQGLPGSEDLDITACLEKIDEWAEKVRNTTSRNYNRFIREPNLFDGSLGKFYMAILCTTLQRDCGVGYNPERAADPGDAHDSRDRFIHGITHGAGGTCASLPVLYAAVGRRLGYPLRIVMGARHLFLRWDESDSQSPLMRDRFNIEATAQGFVSHPDRFYEQWPFPHPDPAIDPRYYLRSLTPREELAEFMCIRSIVLMDNGRFVDAIQPAAWARQLDPSDYSIKVHLELTMLMALGILDEKPPWVDAQPMIRPDGAKWSRYWWPRPRENRQLLPAAQLPSHVLARILPHDGPELEVGALADALYERTNHYANDAYISQVCHAVIAEHTAEVLRHNAMNRARREAIFDNTLSRIPNSIVSPRPEQGVELPNVQRPAIPIVTGTPVPIPPFGLPNSEGMSNGIPSIRGAPNLTPAINQPMVPHNTLPLRTRRQSFLMRELRVHKQPHNDREIRN